MQTKETALQAMGLAAFLPGFRKAVELLKSELDEMERALQTLQEGGAIYKKLGRPALSDQRRALNLLETVKAARANGKASTKTTAHGTPLKPGYWAKMTATERAAEMRRRREVQLGRAKPPRANKFAQARAEKKTAKPAKMHPRDPRHPGHKAWKEKIAAAHAAWRKRVGPEVLAANGRKAAAARVNGAAHA